MKWYLSCKASSEEAILRVQRMERCFDTLLQAAESSAAIPEDCLRQLIQYYEGGQWQRDYELEEAGWFPPELKRGVLSQDAVYDFLEAYGKKD